MAQRKAIVFTVALVVFLAAFMVPSVPYQQTRSMQLAFADKLVVGAPDAAREDSDVPCLRTDAYRASGFPFVYRMDIVEPCGNAGIRNYLAAGLDLIAAGISAAAVMYLYGWWTEQRKPSRRHSGLTKKAGPR